MRLILLLLLIFCNITYATPILMTGMRINHDVNAIQLIFYFNQTPIGNVKALSANTLRFNFYHTQKTFSFVEKKLNAPGKKLKLQMIAPQLQFILQTSQPVRYNIHFTHRNASATIMTVNVFSMTKQHARKQLSQHTQQNNASTSEKKINQPKNFFSTQSQQVLNNMTIDPTQIDTLLATASQQKIKTVNKNKTIIVIDAGHGGKDPGARGDLGSFEKEIVLQIAKQLATLINQDPSLHAVLTRQDDRFVNLRERLKLARKGDADIFIAIHADGYKDNEARGASVYVLSERGATSEAARWLAQHDQYPELGDVHLQTLKDHSLLLRSVLIDMAQTATIRDSLHLGKFILNELDDISSLHHKHVEQAPFLVLKSPDIPSILIETGFITNPDEEKRLTDPTYQKKLASSILSGIKTYLKT